MKQIAFIVQQPKGVSPGQRFRFEIWEPELKESGYMVETFPFFSGNTYKVLYKKGHYFSKVLGVMLGFFNRFRLLFTIRKFDFIFLQREFAPVGPPVFEWIVSKLMKKKIIYDFDDAIWIHNTSKVNRVASWFKAFWKIKYICKWSYKVVAGNDYLCNYARSFNKQVIKIPTCVDTVNWHNQLKNQQTGKIVIGWTGSQSTLKFLEPIIPVLESLREKFNFEFVIIADKAPSFELGFALFVPWNQATEIEDLLQLNIGIMPLDNDPWCEGKCGFKLIQYLSLGIPAVASPIGVNKIIVDDGVNGYLCSSTEEWIKALTTLIKDESLRSQMGQHGRESIINNYSIQSQTNRFLDIFN